MHLWVGNGWCLCSWSRNKGIGKGEICGFIELYQNIPTYIEKGVSYILFIWSFLFRVDLLCDTMAYLQTSQLGGRGIWECSQIIEWLSVVDLLDAMRSSVCIMR